MNNTITTIDQKIAEWFNSNFNKGGDWNYGNLLLCVIAILLTLILCTFIGIERERRRRSAGLRTHLLVGLGSCIVMIISIYGFPNLGMTRDVGRIAAQVVTGVGFLGAGTIMHNNTGIKGLTTASTIWLVMAIGLACGSMNFILAIISTLVVMLILILFRKFEVAVNKNNCLFSVIGKPNAPILASILKVAKINNLAISDVTSDIINSDDGDSVEITFKVSKSDGSEFDSSLFINQLNTDQNIIGVQIVNHHN